MGGSVLLGGVHAAGGVELSRRVDAAVPATADTIELARRIQAGDREAEDELVRRYGRGVTLILRRVVGDASTCDDLRQDTFRIALTKIRNGDLRDPARLSGFVCGVARNLGLEHFRRISRAPLVDDVESAARLPDPEPGPLEGLLEREKAALVRQVLRELGSDRDRQLLYRLYIGEEPKERICLQLGLTSAQFNRVLHRALGRYRELYKRARKGR